jgi:hypothetical protein
MRSIACQAKALSTLDLQQLVSYVNAPIALVPAFSTALRSFLVLLFVCFRFHQIHFSLGKCDSSPILAGFRYLMVKLTAS